MPPAADTRPVLVIPAAGSGSRLKADLPKFAVPVAGRPMAQWLFERYAPWVSGIVLVVSPAGLPHARAIATGAPCEVRLAVQSHPTGMLDAVLLAREAVAASAGRDVWITWCDQIAVSRHTVSALANLSATHPDAWMVLPTVTRPDPYIHFDRDRAGRITAVRHRREGDAMPEVGEGDVGLFCLSRRSYLDRLSEYAEAVALGTATGERNLLPFIPWAAARGAVITFPVADVMESVGINTPEELRAVESWLAARAHA